MSDMLALPFYCLAVIVVLALTIRHNRLGSVVTLAAIAVSLIACNPQGKIKWSAFGSDVLGCAAPGIQAIVGAGLNSLISLARGSDSGDWKAIGEQLGATYGIPMTLCVVDAAVKRFTVVGVAPASSPPDEERAAAAALWLRMHVDEWAK